MLREPNPLLQQSKNKNINIVAVSWSIIHALFNINKNNANLHGSNPPHPDPTTDTGIGAGFGGATGKQAHLQLQPQLHLHFLDMTYPPFLGHGFNVIYSSSLASTNSTSSSVVLTSLASKLKISFEASSSISQALLPPRTNSRINIIKIIFPYPPKLPRLPP